MHDNGASYCRPTRLLNSTLPALTRDRAMTPSRHVPDPPKLWRDFGHFCASAPFVFVKTNLIVGPPFEPKALTLGRLAPAVGAMNAQVKSGPTDMAARYGVGTTVLEMARAFRRLSVESVRRDSSGLFSPSGAVASVLASRQREASDHCRLHFERSAQCPGTTMLRCRSGRRQSSALIRNAQNLFKGRSGSPPYLPRESPRFGHHVPEHRR